MFDESIIIILITAAIAAIMSIVGFVFLLVFRNTQKVRYAKNQEELLARLDSVKDEITKAVIHKIENSDEIIVTKFDAVKIQVLENLAKNDADMAVLRDILRKKMDSILKEIKAPLEIE
jgi:hypothetical protein